MNDQELSHEHSDEDDVGEERLDARVDQAPETPAAATAANDVGLEEPAAQGEVDGVADAAVAAVSLDDVVAGIDVSLANEATDLGETSESIEPRATGEVRRHIVFTLAGSHYATPVGSVVEIGHVPPVTPVPNVPAWVQGVTNLRGEILAIVDLRRFFELEDDGTEGVGRMLVTRAAGEDLTAGLIVDDVRGVASLSAADLSAPTASYDDRIAPFVTGVQERDGRRLAVLDLESLLNSREIRQLG